MTPQAAKSKPASARPVSPRSASSKAMFDLPEKPPADKARARRILKALYECYPDAHCELNYSQPHELLIATILSAQSTDVAVNKATPKLFQDYPTPHHFANATPKRIETYINSIGLYRNKAKAVVESMQRIVEQHNGNVPQTMNELLALRGVARKTANVVLGNAFGINMGVVVDTHVARISQRFGLTMEHAPKKIERDLMALFPRREWTMLSHLMIFHGRRACKARGGLCHEHPICQRYCSEARHRST